MDGGKLTLPRSEERSELGRFDRCDVDERGVRSGANPAIVAYEPPEDRTCRDR